MCLKPDKASTALGPTLSSHADVLVCPACGGALDVPDDGDGSGVECRECNHSFKNDQGIPLLFWPNEWDPSSVDVTDTIKAFYEENPFPNYEEIDSAQTLVERAERRIFPPLLNDQVPDDAMILDVGCGTGQLSNFLGMKPRRTVFGADICLNSLRLGEGFRRLNQIDNVSFMQMNLFRPVFRPESFDLVICNGVLHHTSDPVRGFESIATLVKQGGFILIGLYNTYGRVPLNVQKLLLKLSGDRLKLLDGRLRGDHHTDLRKHVWFMDQYKNPHESTHTFGDVRNWFERNGFDFTNSIPKPKILESLTSSERLFEANRGGTNLCCFFVQLRMALAGVREGGFFIMIGRKQSRRNGS